MHIHAGAGRKASHGHLPASALPELLGLAVWLSMETVAAQIPLNPEIVGLPVVEALQTTGRASVLIALRQSSAMAAYQTDLASLQSSVASTQDSVLAVMAPDEFQLQKRFQAVPALCVTLSSMSALIRLAAHPAVLKIDLDEGGGTGGLANSVPKIGANLWHATGVRGNNVIVAILDSGVDAGHKDLLGAVVHEACFADNNGSIDGVGACPNGSDRQTGAGSAVDDVGHGTHVSGIVGSRGNVSSVGVAPGAQIVAIKVTYGDKSNFAGTFYSFSEITAALDYLITHPKLDAKIINMSFGTTALFSGHCDNAYSWTMAGAAAIGTLRSRGVIAFAGAGNNSSGTKMTAPACFSNVISVGSTDNSDVVAADSNSNAYTDIFAPGVNITSDAIGGGTLAASGTSMASPHAAGCAALFVQAGLATTPAQIEALLKTSPFRVTDPTNGLTFPRIYCHTMIRYVPLIRR